MWKWKEKVHNARQSKDNCMVKTGKENLHLEAFSEPITYQKHGFTVS